MNVNYWLVTMPIGWFREQQVKMQDVENFLSVRQVQLGLLFAKERINNGDKKWLMKQKNCLDKGRTAPCILTTSIWNKSIQKKHYFFCKL